MAEKRSKDWILNIYSIHEVMSGVEEIRSDFKAKIDIGAYPGGGLIYRYPPPKKKKLGFW